MDLVLDDVNLRLICLKVATDDVSLANDVYQFVSQGKSFYDKELRLECAKLSVTPYGCYPFGLHLDEAERYYQFVRNGIVSE